MNASKQTLGRLISLGLAVSLARCSRPEPQTHSPARTNTAPTAPTTPTANPTANPTATPGTLRVDDAARTALIAEGTPAPHFHAVASNGTVIDSHGVRARPLVVYFFPRDETPGCTVEAEGFRDMAQQYTAAGIDVMGVSTDDTASHQGFATQHNLPFSLVSDPDGRLAASFGVAVRMGFAQRITIVINKMGNVVKVYPSVSPSGHAAEVLALARTI